MSKYKSVIVIIASVLVIAGGIAELIYIDKTFEEFIERIDYILAQDQYSVEDVKDTEEWLKRKHKGLEFLIPHDQLNELSISFNEVSGAVERQDYEAASAMLHRTREYAIRLNDLYSLRIQNIV
ncbi:MAG: DUF4363 family protein [Bacillota bacterium]|jgi:hypothetical protein|nr:DUF4363 family protein [Bacillota bacterium]HHU43883.1 DUF4363 family protein [Clostridiales bacterium]